MKWHVKSVLGKLGAKRTDRTYSHRYQARVNPSKSSTRAKVLIGDVRWNKHITYDRILQAALAAWNQDNFVEVADQVNDQFTFTDRGLGLEFKDRGTLASGQTTETN